MKITEIIFFVYRFCKNILILILVLLFSPLFYVKILINKIKLGRGKGKRILIINNVKIGDMVCFTPILRAIKERYPDSYLALLVTPRVEKVIENNKRIDNLIVFGMNQPKSWKETKDLIKKIKEQKFDICITSIPGTLGYIIPFVCGIPTRIITTHEGYGIFYYILSFLGSHRIKMARNKLSIRHHLDSLKFIDIHNDNLKKEVFIKKKDEFRAEKFFKNNGVCNDDVLVGMSLGAGNKFKEWPPSKFAKLADMIINKYGYKIIMTGSISDKDLLEEAQKSSNNKLIITCGDFSLSELPALYKRFNYFVSVDTGPLYIANAVDVPVLDILGPCSPYDQPPIYEKCEIIYNKNLPCWPCSSYVNTVASCKNKRFYLRCLRDISVEDVFNKFEILIKKYK